MIKNIPLRLSGGANAMGKKKKRGAGTDQRNRGLTSTPGPSWDRTSTPGPKQSLTSNQSIKVTASRRCIGMGQKKTRGAWTEQRNRGLTSTPGPNWDRTSTPGPKQSLTSMGPKKHVAPGRSSGTEVSQARRDP